MPGSIDNHIVAESAMKPDLRDIDRYILIPFRLQRVHEERPFKRHIPPATNRLDLLIYTFRKGPRFIQKAADQRRFTVINMTHDNHTKSLFSKRCFDEYASQISGQSLFGQI